ncbi:phosphoribosylformylglycinamidine synthase subunit II [Thermanaeromonas toyohensis ToBE]|uniref:Phosphoribosylformylglycinamidine synthase subunit PurL n=1 Tax=Thermanaeromonas toyohensis ToBE TaxID=698762 RepID=A0A1W1W2Z4_9FIRM|nr:phosphoribosylformylglycinamidine synthase subunit PurL [Thermanaeromonas toyohensis]SMB99830.1 phosphoribosylformylglycinamidine synthase subunit II [Thermanaeromonas toyohensis ToBE]
MLKKPWQEMGLTDEEYERIVHLLGREPNYVELGMFAVMWSEHCGYKHSRPVLKMFPTSAPWVLQGPGENAGIIDIGDGLAVAFKIESHNHPSAIEPFQGAATGVGGIVRDIFAMGARPIALLNSLRFGPLDNPRNRYLLSGVVGGISFYGNCIGVPTVAGEVGFAPCYTSNPLVNVMCVGLIEHDKIQRGRASGIGNSVMVVGARTGRDGIHGATFASEELNEASEERRPSVQVGDPFREKLLIEACLEVVQEDLLVGMQDMGAAGITSSTAETASRAGTGMEIDVDLVPRREEGMTPYEVMLSESQERMLVIPKKGCEERVKEIFDRWGLEAVVIGRVTSDGVLRVKEKGRLVAEIPVRYLTEECPVYVRERRKPEYLSELWAYPLTELPEPLDYGEALLKLLSSPNIASKEWVYRQYDYMVRIDTVVRPGAADAAVLRVKGTKKGLAVTTDGNSRYCYLDPETGGAIAVAEAARNLSCTGARPLGLTDCLNFGNPEKPEVAWQFYHCVLGMSRACTHLNIPVVGGNVSFYNETNGEAIYPTPVVGMVGLLENIEERCTAGFKQEGDLVLLLGETRDELGGSEYLALLHGVVAGRPPELDLNLEAVVQQMVREAIARGLVQAAHDCSEGGLAIALAEMAILGGIGAEITLESPLRPSSLLFSETQSRILVSARPDKVEKLQELARAFQVPVKILGACGGRVLSISLGPKRLVNLSLEEMEAGWRKLTARLGG